MSDINPISIPDPIAVAPYNHAGVEKAIRDLLIAIGENPDRDGLVDTHVESANAQVNDSSELRNIAFAFLRRGHGSKQ